MLMSSAIDPLRTLVEYSTLPAMSTQRSNINVKALGLHWRNGCILAAEVYDSHGRVAGVRPLGGTVEFGESSETALRREFIEELGVEVQVLSDR
jgi:hypothetical protein